MLLELLLQNPISTDIPTLTSQSRFLALRVGCMRPHRPLLCTQPAALCQHQVTRWGGADEKVHYHSSRFRKSISSLENWIFYTWQNKTQAYWSSPQVRQAVVGFHDHEGEEERRNYSLRESELQSKQLDKSDPSPSTVLELGVTYLPFCLTIIRKHL